MSLAEALAAWLWGVLAGRFLAGGSTCVALRPQMD